MSDDILGMEVQFELDALRRKLAEVEKENMRLQQIIRDNDLDISDIPEMSDEEYICMQQISRLREQSEGSAFDQEQAKIFDTLVKDLSIIRGGGGKRKGKSKTKADVAELLSIAKEK